MRNFFVFAMMLLVCLGMHVNDCDAADHERIFLESASDTADDKKNDDPAWVWIVYAIALVLPLPMLWLICHMRKRGLKRLQDQGNGSDSNE